MSRHAATLAGLAVEHYQVGQSQLWLRSTSSCGLKCWFDHSKARLYLHSLRSVKDAKCDSHGCLLVSQKQRCNVLGLTESMVTNRQTVTYLREALQGILADLLDGKVQLASAGSQALWLSRRRTTGLRNAILQRRSCRIVLYTLAITRTWVSRFGTNIWCSCMLSFEQKRVSV